jgi:hypothetical protein
MRHLSLEHPMSPNTCKQSKFYRPRNPEQSPFYKIVNEYFDEFERIYPEKYEKTHGFWRPIIRSSIEQFLKCGDLKEGFARVKCKKCGKEMFVALFHAVRGAVVPHAIPDRNRDFQLNVLWF